MPQPAHDQTGYWMVWGATLAFFAAFYALLTPLPRYLGLVGLPDWQIGMVLGTFGVASLLGRPLAGLATDRWGPRPVMLLGAGCLLVGALAVVSTGNVLLLTGLRLLQAAGYVAFTTAGTGFVVLLTTPAERGRRMAIFGTAANLAITLTPALVSALLVLLPLSTGFLLAGALALVAGLIAWRLPPISLEAAGGTTGQLSFPRRLWVPMLTAGLLGAGFAAFFQFVPILAERRATIAVGWLYTTYGLGLILTRFSAGRLVDRWGTRRMLLVTSLLMASGLALFSVATTPAQLIPATLLVAAAGLFHPTLITHHAALLPEAPGRASAAFYVGFDLGIGLGSWVLGAALQAGGPGALYLSATLIVLGVLPLLPLIEQGRG